MTKISVWMTAGALCLMSTGCDAPMDDQGWADPDVTAHGQDVAHDKDGATRGADVLEDDSTEGDTAPPLESCEPTIGYASEVLDFVPGPEAGFGQANMPGVVLGPPTFGPPTGSSLDVVSLGISGEVVLGFGDQRIIDGPGPDLVVWENPFWISGDPANPFAELGEVAVSEDGETWVTFPCDPSREEGFDPGCAGWRPRLEFDPCEVEATGIEVLGGDPFDLADLGLESARFVRIRDLSSDGSAPSAGFDLDAVGGVHLGP